VRNLACSKAGRESILALGGVEKLVALLAPERAAAVQVLSLSLSLSPSPSLSLSLSLSLSPPLSLSSSSPSFSSSATFSHPCPRTLTPLSPFALQEAAAAAIANLAEEEACRECVAQAGGLALLSALCDSSSNDQARPLSLSLFPFLSVSASLCL